LPASNRVTDWQQCEV